MVLLRAKARLLILLATGAGGAGLVPAATPGDAAWQVEERISRDIRQAGTAALVKQPLPPPPLTDHPLARGLAAALWWRARGDESQAFKAAAAALAGSAEPEEISLRAALLLEALEMGTPPAGSPLRPGLEKDWAGLAVAARAAAAGDCPRAEPLLEGLGREVLADPASARLAAWSLERCARGGDALAVLVRAVENRAEKIPDPRLALAAGEILLRRGDPEGALAWCSSAADAGNGLPRIRLRAGVCAACAEAARGVLPAGRQAYIEVRRRQLLEPALPLKERIHAGAAAAWTALGDQTEEGAGVAQEILAAMDVFPLSGADRQMWTALRALCALELNRLGEARELLDGLSPFAGIREEALASFVEGRFRQRQLDAVAASAAWSHAAESAALAHAPELEAAILAARAADAADEPDPNRARFLVRQALERWPAGGPQGATTPFADPAFPRRIVEKALLASWYGENPNPREAGRLIGDLEGMRLALAGRGGGSAEIPEKDRLERHLASRDAVLALWLIGESRVFLWLADPSGVEGRVLGGPSDLQPRMEAGGAWPGLEEALRRFPRGVQLFIVPDGFLWNAAWNGLPLLAPPGRSPISLRDYFRPAVVPSLFQVVAPDDVAAPARREGPRFLALTPRGTGERLAQTAGEQRAGFSSFRVMSGLKEEWPEVERRIAHGLTVLHLGLPLLSGGASGEAVEWELTFPAEDAGYPAALSLETLLEGHGPIRLATLSSAGPRTLSGASQVRAAGHLVEHGISAALVFPPGRTPEDSVDIWRPFLERLAGGDAVGQAMKGISHAAGAEFILVGNADARVLSPPRAAWPFWAASGAGVFVLFLVALRWLKRRRDPFAVEPPEEAGA